MPELPVPSYLPICLHNAVARPERLPAGIAVFHALHFALDICNMPSPLFTGLPAMLQNLPFMEQEIRRCLLCPASPPYSDVLSSLVASASTSIAVSQP